MKTYNDTVWGRDFIVKVSIDGWGLVDFNVYQQKPRRFGKGKKEVLFCSGVCTKDIKECVREKIRDTIEAESQTRNTFAEYNNL